VLAKVNCPRWRPSHSALVTLFFVAIFTTLLSPILLSDRLLANGDALLYYLPAFVSPRTLWTTALYGGYPIAADPQAESWYPVGFLFLHRRELWNLFVLSAYVLAGSFTYGYLYSLTDSPLAAAVGGIAYSMSGFMIAHMGHTAIIHTAAWLPLIVWALEELRHRFSRAWFTIGALAVGCCALAGHPQPFVYSLSVAGIYALVLGLDTSEPLSYYSSCLALAALGIGLAALQLIPTWELAQLSNRAKMSYDTFINVSLSPRLLFTLPFPYLFGGQPPYFRGLPYTGSLGNWWRPEAIGYTGLLPIMLSAIGFGLYSKRRHWWFWLLICAASLLLALGGATPVARMMFHMPAYDKFDVPARYIMTFGFAVSVLAGLGIAAIEHRSASRRCVGVGIAICIAFVLLDLILIVLLPGSLRLLPPTTGGPWPAHVFSDPAILLPLLMLLLSTVSLLYWTILPASRWRQAIMLLVLIVDLGLFAWVEFSGLQYPSPTVTEPPMYAEHLKAKLSSWAQRILPVAGGLESLSLIPPNMSRVWKVPSASGYGPLILSRTSALLGMQPAGQIAGFWPDPSDRSLDIVAARFILVPNRGPEEPVSKGGFEWAGSEMELTFGPGCSASSDYNVATAFQLPAAFEADTVGLVGFLGCSIDVPQDAEVLQILITNESGKKNSYSIRAGRDIAEWAYDCEDVASRVRHHRAAVFSSFSIDRPSFRPCQAHTYLATVRLASASRISRLELRWTGTIGQIAVRGISLRNSGTAKSFPITYLESALAHPERWRLVGKIGSTSVLENRRALPRAWLVPEVIGIRPDLILKAIRTSQLPGGRVFDPTRLALVEVPLHYTTLAADSLATARVLKSTETRMFVETASRTPGFLVTSDTNYPGWRARVDGRHAHIFKTDYLLRGVMIPAGHHLVSFRFRPDSFFIGASISAISVFLLCCLCLAPRLRRYASLVYDIDK
jgi:hypothetical protein